MILLLYTAKLALQEVASLLVLFALQQIKYAFHNACKLSMGIIAKIAMLCVAIALDLPRMIASIVPELPLLAFPNTQDPSATALALQADTTTPLPTPASLAMLTVQSALALTTQSASLATLPSLSSQIPIV